MLAPRGGGPPWGEAAGALARVGIPPSQENGCEHLMVVRANERSKLGV
jgi:hypothetical protein